MIKLFLHFRDFKFGKSLDGISWLEQLISDTATLKFQKATIMTEILSFGNTHNTRLFKTRMVRLGAMTVCDISFKDRHQTDKADSLSATQPLSIFAMPVSGNVIAVHALGKLYTETVNKNISPT